MKNGDFNCTWCILLGSLATWYLHLLGVWDVSAAWGWKNIGLIGTRSFAVILKWVLCAWVFPAGSLGQFSAGLASYRYVSEGVCSALSAVWTGHFHYFEWPWFSKVQIPTCACSKSESGGVTVFEYCHVIYSCIYLTVVKRFARGISSCLIAEQFICV